VIFNHTTRTKLFSYLGFDTETFSQLPRDFFRILRCAEHERIFALRETHAEGLPVYHSDVGARFGTRAGKGVSDSAVTACYDHTFFCVAEVGLLCK